MTWRRVAVVYGVLALLVGYLIAFDGTAPAPSEPGNAPVLPAASLLDADATAVRSMTFRKEGRTVRATRVDGRWRAIEPTDAVVPPDLFEATLATLTAGQAAEKLSHQPDHSLADFGLEAPAATVEIVIGEADAAPISVSIGAHNPTQTAVYARRSDQDFIFLVGMNLRYYIDLIFEAANA
jgi:hypothetical protein